MKRTFLFFFLLGFVLSEQGVGQLTDYSDSLNLPYEFEHLLLTLEVDADSATFRGVATWNMRATAEQVDSLFLIALRTDVKSVRFNESNVDFEMRNDTLLIQFPVPILLDEVFKVEVIYSAMPQFGTHRTKSGTIFTSLMPGARSDLFPTIAHPSIQVKTDIRLIVPNHWKAVATGIFAGSTLMHDERRLYHWKMDQPVSVTDISMAMGELDVISVRRSNVEYRFYKESAITTELDEFELLDRFILYTNRADSLLGITYPYGSHNVVYLDDHMWESRSFAAGFSYIFKNAGSIESQIRRTVAAQYFGSYHRAETLSGSDHILLSQAALNLQLDKNFVLESLIWDDVVYPIQNTWRTWDHSRWMDAVATVQRNPDFQAFSTESLSALIAQPSGSYAQQDYLDILGLVESYPEIAQDPVPQYTDFTVNYQLDEINNRISLEFIPMNASDDMLIPVRIIQFVSGGTNELNFMVSSLGDRVTFSFSGFITNMYIMPDDQFVRFTENKPSEFWMYQLRNDSDYERRVEAAMGFGRITDDPDIQLFLQDLIRNEPDQYVRSILVSSFSTIVQGALGTHQRFLDLLNDRSSIIRHTALEALRKYPSNEQVRNAIYHIISTSPDIELVNHAIDVYFDVADEAEFFATGRGLLVEDQKDLDFTAVILPLIVQTQQGKVFAPNLMQYLEKEFPFFIRKIAFEILKEVEILPSYWEELLPVLSTDPDPRVRYLALECINKVSNVVALDILNSRSYNEYDVRVLHQVQNLLSR